MALSTDKGCIGLTKIGLKLIWLSWCQVLHGHNFHQCKTGGYWFSLHLYFSQCKLNQHKSGLKWIQCVYVFSLV